MPFMTASMVPAERLKGTVVTLGLIGILGITLFLSRAFSQENATEMMRVERAVAKYAKTLYATNPLGFDEGIIPGPMPTPPKASYRNSQHITQLAADAGARVVRLNDVVVCSSERDPRSCTMHDVKAVIRIGTPIVSGDRATVWLYVREASPSGLTPVSSSDKELLLIRELATWRVVRVLQFRET